MSAKSYRKNVGLIVLNQENQLLVCRRKDRKTWQFPQGGIDHDESPKQAVYRELFEEVGIKKKDVKIIQESAHWYQYDLPKEYQKRSDSLKKFKGQTQKWFMLKGKSELSVSFLNDIQQEFDRFQWVSYWYPLSHIINFKKPVYEKVLNEFLPQYIELANV